MKKLFLSISLGISLACFLIPAISFAEELSSEEKCLAEAIYFEARDQPTIGMVAVALVVKNRVKSTVNLNIKLILKILKKWSLLEN